MNRKINMNFKQHNTKHQLGITLIALVITIVVLLIISGVAISLITGGENLFSKTKYSDDKYTEESSYEALYMALKQATIERYTNGLTDNELNDFLESNPNILVIDETEVLVGGYLYEIDRNELTIVNRLGKSVGLILTGRAKSEWVSTSEDGTAIIDGKVIKGNSKIVESTITKDSGTPQNLEINEDDTYSIEVTEGGRYVIYVKTDAPDGNEYWREVIVTIKVDDTPPVIEEATVEFEESNLKIHAKGNDKKDGVEQSGINYYKYSITPVDGVSEPAGNFDGDILIPITNFDVVYIIDISALDNAGNESEVRSIATGPVPPNNFALSIKSKTNTNVTIGGSTTSKVGTSIKYKYGITQTKGSINWDSITEEEEETHTFSITKGITYYLYMQAIEEGGGTINATNNGTEVWVPVTVNYSNKGTYISSITGSSYYSSYTPALVMDGKNTGPTKWHSGTGQNSSSANQWLKFTLKKAYRIRSFTLANGDGASNGTACAIKSFRLQGSNNNSSWTTLQTFTNNNNTPYNKNTYNVTYSYPNGGFTYYRIYVVSGYNSGYLMLGEVTINLTT